MEKLFFKPCGLLSPYIDRFWVWKDTSGAQIEMPIMLPGTGLELFIHFANPLTINNICLPQSHIACPRSIATLNNANNLNFIAIRFCSGAFRHFSPIPFTEINNKFISIEDVWGKDALVLQNQLTENKEYSKKVEILEQFLINKLMRYKKDDAQYWDMAINKLYYNFQTIELENLANIKNISYRHFERGFKAQFGTTPKKFQMVSRFQNTVRKLLLAKEKNYLPVALDNGYFDQAHFIKEFEVNSGTTPSAFLTERNFMSHFYNTSLK